MSNSPEYQAAYYQANRGRMDMQRMNCHDRLKRDVVNGYGGKCARCGFDNILALCIDHVRDNGAEERAKFGRVKMFGDSFLRTLRKAGFPPGYQVLCANCNTIKEHERRRKHAIEKCQASKADGCGSSLV